LFLVVAGAFVQVRESPPFLPVGALLL